MKIFAVFNHPAPYKVALFNGLAAFFDMHVIFERSKVKNRNSLFYQNPEYKFSTHPIRGIKLGAENFLSWGIKRHLKKNHYDLIIINGYSTLAEMIAIRYLKKHNIPYIFAINGGVVRLKENRLIRAIKHYFLTGAQSYLSPSCEADKYLCHYGIPRRLIHHYPYSTIYEHEVATSPLNSSEKKLQREKIGIRGEQVFVNVGQFIQRKNNMALLDIWRAMPPSRSLVLVGDGPDKAQYQKYIEQYHLHNVYLLDFMSKPDLLKFLRLADYAIFLSKEDIYGHVINEALSQGLGVIGSCHMVAAQTLIKDGINGYLIDPANKDQILTQISQLVTKNFYAGAIATARENTIELMVAAHVKFFREVRS